MLKPINAQTQAPLGIFNVDATWQTAGIEGGYVGYLAKDGYGIGVAMATPTLAAAATGNVVGLVDDSTTGSNYSTLFGSIQPKAAAATTIGPSTILGSGKCTLWTQPGLYVTDQLTNYVSGSGNVAVYVGSNGKLTVTATSPATIVGRVLATADRTSGLLYSLVSAYNDIFVTTTTLYVIYYQGPLALS